MSAFFAVTMRERGDPSEIPSWAARDQPGMATWSWNVASGEVVWSPGIDALFGLPDGGFGGTYEAYLALVHPDDRAHFEALIQRTLDGEDEYVMSHRVIWPDGSVHWIDGRGRLTRDEEGKPLRLEGVSWDARARSRTDSKAIHLRRMQAVAGAVSKELLRVRTESEALERACKIVVEHGHFRFAWVGLVAEDGARLVPVAHAGVEEGYLRENCRNIDLRGNSGGPVERAVRSGAPVVVDDVSQDETFAPWREAALRRGYRGCATFPLRRSAAIVGALVIYTTGEHRFDHEQLELLRSLVDDIDLTLDVIDEAARLRSTEQAMARSEERFRALFEHASDGLVIADGEDRIVEVNPAMCEMTGYTRDELRAKKAADLSTRIAIGRAPLGRSAVEERRLTRKDGTFIDAEVSATVLADGRIQAHWRDVTLRNRMQQQLILADRLASLGRLAAGVAHEVNNPLAYTMLSLQRIDRAVANAEDSPMTVEVKAAAAQALDGAERVRAVVRALGALGREDDEPTSSVDIHRVLDAAVRLSDNRVRHRGRIVRDYAATRGVRGHELRLGQVFVNLLVNAADALPADSAHANEIRVRTFDEGGEVVVEVRDNGQGIPQDIIGRIFDPFFTTKGVGEGTGLGLSISHSILDSFGATIGVESTVGVETIFRVRLVAEPLTQPQATGKLDERRGARARVLIVDDEPTLAATLARCLDSHDVTIGTSGREALELCLRGDFDCIFCDVMMPGMGGIELVDELLKQRPWLAKRVVFMTGGAFTNHARELIATLPNQILEKPFEPQRLEDAIAEMRAIAQSS